MAVMTRDDVEVLRRKRSWPAQYQLDVFAKIDAAKASGEPVGEIRNQRDVGALEALKVSRVGRPPRSAGSQPSRLLHYRFAVSKSLGDSMIVQRRGPAIALMVLFAFGSSCSASADDASSDMLLEDYRAGFQEFSDCVSDAGGEVVATETSPLSGRITYQLSGPAGSQITPEIEQCQSAFEAIEIRFDLESPEVQEESRQQLVGWFTETVNPCLEDNGFDLINVEAPDEPEAVTLISEYQRLEENGACR